MKWILPIFALLIASCDDKENLCRFPVTISDASPIQFWLSDCDTYNEREVCGVHHKCWCHPWQCGDEIKVQFTDEDETAEYLLQIVRQDAATEEMPFIKQDFNVPTEVTLTFTNPEFEGSLSPWTNRAISFPNVAAPSFTWLGDQATINEVVGGTAEGNSRALSISRGGGVLWPAGTYRVRLTIANGSGLGGANEGGDIRVRVYDAAGTTGSVLLGTYPDLVPNDPGVFYDIEHEFVVGDPFQFMGFQLTLENVSGSTPELITQIESIELIESPTVEMSYGYSTFDASFIPSDLGICSEQIQLKIVRTSGSPDAEVAKSDCIDLKSEQDCTSLIEYSNNRNFAGLIYENTSPATSFKIRVPAIFFHERFPEEDEAMELTTGIQKTSGFVKAQRLFETDYMPYYMHRKLKLIFKHQDILIDNQYWTKEDAYEIQDGDRRWPVKKAKCFLTERNFVQRVVL